MSLALSPPEAFVLWSGPRSPVETFKIAVMHLMALGVLRTVTQSRRAFLGGRIETVRIERTGRALPDPGLLGGVLAVAERAQGRPMQAFIAEARRRFGSSFQRYVWTVIVPDLERRGLVTVRRARFLLVPLPWRRVRPTAAGRTALAGIEATLQQARRLPDLLRRRPKEAVALALAAGGLLLLLPELRGLYGELGQAILRHGGGSGGDASGPSGETAAPSREASAGVDWESLDPQAWDTLDSGLSSFDASFDAGTGSGDGGGDGGGGGD